jgi:hypothetical protein
MILSNISTNSLSYQRLLEPFPNMPVHFHLYNPLSDYISSYLSSYVENQITIVVSLQVEIPLYDFIK